MNLGLSIELMPSRVKLSHVSHSFLIYFAFFFEFKEDSLYPFYTSLLKSASL